MVISGVHSTWTVSSSGQSYLVAPSSVDAWGAMWLQCHTAMSHKGITRQGKPTRTHDRLTTQTLSPQHMQTLTVQHPVLQTKDIPWGFGVITKLSLLRTIGVQACSKVLGFKSWHTTEEATMNAMIATRSDVQNWTAHCYTSRQIWSTSRLYMAKKHFLKYITV